MTNNKNYKVQTIFSIGLTDQQAEEFKQRVEDMKEEYIIEIQKNNIFDAVIKKLEQLRDDESEVSIDISNDFTERWGFKPMLTRRKITIEYEAHGDDDLYDENS